MRNTINETKYYFNETNFEQKGNLKLTLILNILPWKTKCKSNEYTIDQYV